MHSSASNELGFAWEVTTPPEQEPVSLGEIEEHLTLDGCLADEDAAMLLGLITAAREMAEDYQWRQLCTATITLVMDRFPCWVILLPRPKLQSVTSIKYIDFEGVLQTLDPGEYQVSTRAQPGYVCPAYGKSWPATRCQPEAVTIEYVAGYGGPESVPETTKTAIKLLVGHWYANKEAVVDRSMSSLPMGVRSLLDVGSRRGVK